MSHLCVKHIFKSIASCLFDDKLKTTFIEDFIDAEIDVQVSKSAVPLTATRGYTQTQSLPTDSCVDMPNFTTEINVFIA